MYHVPISTTAVLLPPPKVGLCPARAHVFCMHSDR